MKVVYDKLNVDLDRLFFSEMKWTPEQRKMKV